MEPEHPQLHQLCTQKHHFYKWNHELSQWQTYKDLNEDYHTIDNITTLSFNVLLDESQGKTYKKNVVFSEERYESTLKEVGEIMPHIATFNEVTMNFVKMLEEKPWAREHYWISAVSQDIRTLGPRRVDKGFGNLLITKIPPYCLEVFMIYTCPRPVITGFFNIRNSQGQKKTISFSAVHLTALAMNQERRINQLKSLSKQFEKFKDVTDCHILQGDMNFHAEEENKIIQELNYYDCWLQIYDLKDNPGYTFDADYNSLINQLWWGFEGRRMRLDRMFGTQKVTVNKMKVIFDKAIYGKKDNNEEYQKQLVKRQNKLKGAISFLFDLADRNAFREKEEYLFKSDHFGLLAQISF